MSNKCMLTEDVLSSSETKATDALKISVRPVVCDYGIYENDKLLTVINNRFNALLIKAILVKDVKYGQGFNGNPKFSKEDFQALLDALTKKETDNGR